MSQKGGYYPPVIEKPGQAHYSSYPHMPQPQPYQSYQGQQPYAPHPQPNIVYVQQPQQDNSGSTAAAVLPCAWLCTHDVVSSDPLHPLFMP
ncbi:hypothetical protein CVT24_013394 [Panaeolus cyanescens]|uniref:Uncharacterized protein n=1 Tax=Panaeolus cyanescens TaxID=181874 RepID=A0A409YML8_9AGAR|nr:hypothetical protein CVT24_013394 [Panaeolus cyanescens]